MRASHLGGPPLQPGSWPDAARLLLTRVAQEGALPFAPLIPNAVTIEAMKEARKGGLPQFHSVQSLVDDLHAQD